MHSKQNYLNKKKKKSMPLKSNSAFQELFSVIRWILRRKCQKSVICPVTYIIKQPGLKYQDYGFTYIPFKANNIRKIDISS